MPPTNEVLHFGCEAILHVNRSLSMSNSERGYNTQLHPTPCLFHYYGT